MFDIKFCKSTRQRYAKDIRRAQTEAAASLAKKVEDERLRALARSKQSVQELTQATVVAMS